MIVAASTGFPIFIMEVQCVYCGVGIEYLSVIWICVRSDVLTAVLLHGRLFWYIIPCRVGNSYGSSAKDARIRASVAVQLMFGCGRLWC